MKDDLVFLLVDDVEDYRFLARHALRKGFQMARFAETADSDDAVAVLQNEPVTLVIAHRSQDADMLPLVEKLRAATAIPIIAISGSHRDEERVMKAGASAFLQPDPWSQLVPLVYRFLPLAT